MTRIRLLVGVMGFAILVPTLPASAQEVFAFEGAGWGHAVGMSQYGARAMAEAGHTAQQIVTYYYTGTSVAPVANVLAPEHFLRSDPDPLWIGLAQNRTLLRIQAQDGPVGLCLSGDSVCPSLFAQPGEAWELRALGNGTCQFFRDGIASGGVGQCWADLTWENQPNVRVSLPDLGRTYARGVLRVRPSGLAFHVMVEIGLEPYLYGLGEMPSSWHPEALAAQAIAGRTYGVRQALRYGPEPTMSASRRAQCWCQLYASSVDQNYVGWSKESGSFGTSWVAAVNATAGQLITHPAAPDSTVIIAYYSSSTGGATESNVTGFGHTTPLPYLQTVPDPWSVDPVAQNPFASWTKQLTDAEIAAAVGLDSITGIEVVSRNPSGSAAQVAISGTLGGVPTTITRSGRFVKGALGLRSTFFSVVGSGVTQAPAGFCDSTSPEAGFVDVSSDSPHHDDINCVALVGITTGTAPSTFDPGGDVTRWQMALFLVRTAKALGVVVPAAEDRGFVDLAGLSPEAVLAVNQLAELGITTGTSPTTYDPYAPVTRWQMALFLIRLHQAAGYDAPSAVDQGFGDLGGLSQQALDAINQLRMLGVTAGTGPGTYGPAQVVLREQMASFLARLVRIDT